MADMVEENFFAGGQLTVDFGLCALNCHTPCLPITCCVLSSWSQDCIADDDEALAQVMLQFQTDENHSTMHVKYMRAEQ